MLGPILLELVRLRAQHKRKPVLTQLLLLAQAPPFPLLLRLALSVG
jgi:hypothetical protein